MPIVQYKFKVHNCVQLNKPVLFGVLLSDRNLQQYIGKSLAQMYTIDNKKETITILWFGE